VVDDDHRFCAACWLGIDFLNGPGCAGCGLPFAHAEDPGMLCGECIAEPPVHDGVRAAVAYGDTARAVVLKLKYARRPGMARIIAQHLARHIDPAEDALLLPVPLHRWRIWSRGFNQSALIARALARESGLPLILDGLRRDRATPPLRGLGRKQRAKAVRGAFTVPATARSRIKGRTIYLVDDVYTSGATAGACAHILKAAGAERVVILCWARVMPGEDAY